MAKVVHISTCHIPFDQRVFHRECVSLTRAGYEVRLLAYHDGDVRRDGVGVVSLGAPASGKPSMKLAERRRRSARAGRIAEALRADVYHVHDLELIPAALHLRRHTSARVIYDCHEDNVAFMRQKEHVPRPLRWSLSKVVRWLEWRAASKLDAVITADPGVAARFKRWGARTEVLYNFPRLDLFPYVTAQKEATADLVYHGSIPRYHLGMVFRVDDALMRRGRLVRWSMFGQFQDIEWARRHAEARGALGRMTLGERIPAEQVAARVRQARIGIIPLPDLPKFQANIPTKLFEFWALGMPVVLSDLPATRPFVADGRCALAVPPSDPDAYAAAVIRLLDSPALCAAMGVEGRRRVESDLNWEREGTKLISLYRELLER